jgi:hypothetical protein
VIELANPGEYAATAHLISSLPERVWRDVRVGELTFANCPALIRRDSPRARRRDDYQQLRRSHMPVYADVQAILDAIANNANGDVDLSPHRRFWSVSRQTFLSGEVPNITIAGVTYHIPIVNSSNPLQSAFFQILLGPLTVTSGASTATIVQMPKGGPFITDSGFSVTVNGVNKSGTDIQNDLTNWLTNGMP